MKNSELMLYDLIRHKLEVYSKEHKLLDDYRIVVDSHICQELLEDIITNAFDINAYFVIKPYKNTKLQIIIVEL